ncbi:hypothetical protein F0L68_08560 [Solihabitans fulvus]|uniref:Uncharacterized protein n=1 Tax=Solihabitans fulvus TaxID=1892852 RepID=A0A5B2XL00_9PSEU|nr:hypothetical protein [Solihabitans fulvus]KAA2264033.1 hypothetical protein F0L68_08560 [Solihabitans fulvus]
MAVFLTLVAGCSSGSDGPQTTPTHSADPVQAERLLVKVRALEADQCQTVAAERVVHDCARYVAQVAIATGDLRAQLAGNSAGLDAVQALQAGADAYQQNSCDASDAPVPTCTQALNAMRTALPRVETGLTTK